MGRTAAVLLVLLLPAAGAFNADATVRTGPKRCGTIQVDGKRYAVRAHRMECRRAVTLTRRYLRGDGHPSGWKCRRHSGAKIAFVCWRGGKDYYAIKR